MWNCLAVSWEGWITKLVLPLANVYTHAMSIAKQWVMWLIGRKECFRLNFQKCTTYPRRFIFSKEFWLCWPGGPHHVAFPGIAVLWVCYIECDPCIWTAAPAWESIWRSPVLSDPLVGRLLGGILSEIQYSPWQGSLLGFTVWKPLFYLPLSGFLGGKVCCLTS